MTAYVELQTVVKAKRNGLIRYYINKPFNLDEIRDLVNNVLLEYREKKAPVWKSLKESLYLCLSKLIVRTTLIIY